MYDLCMRRRRRLNLQKNHHECEMIPRWQTVQILDRVIYRSDLLEPDSILNHKLASIWPLREVWSQSFPLSHSFLPSIVPRIFSSRMMIRMTIGMMMIGMSMRKILNLNQKHVWLGKVTGSRRFGFRINLKSRTWLKIREQKNKKNMGKEEKNMERKEQ